MKRKALSLLCACALAAMGAFALAGCSGVQQQEQSSSQDVQVQEPQTIKIGCPDENGMLTDNGRIAQALGYLDEELRAAGYEPEYVSFGWGGVPLNEALAAGEVDVAFSDAWAETLLKASGIDVKAVATINSAGQNGICVQAASDISAVGDLAEKRVICPTGSAQEMYLNEAAAAGGLDLSTVQRVDTVSDMVTLFMSGEADALLYGLYTSYYMEDYQVGKTLCTTKESPEQWTQSYVVATSDYWEENGEAAKAIIRALDRAQKWAETTAANDPAELFKTMSKDEQAASINERIYDFDMSFSFFKPSIEQAAIERYDVMSAYMFENGLIKTEVSSADFFDVSFLKAVSKEG